MSTKTGAIIAVLLCTLLTASAQIFYKFGIQKLSLAFPEVLLNYYIWIGLALYAVGAGILIIALRHGELSVLYPLIASGYIWVNLLSAYLFAEALNVWKVAGIGVIIVGMLCIGLGSNGGVPA